MLHSVSPLATVWCRRTDRFPESAARAPVAEFVRWPDAAVEERRSDDPADDEPRSPDALPDVAVEARRSLDAVESAREPARRSPDPLLEAEARRSADPAAADGARAVPLLADDERRAESGRDVLAVADEDARGMRSVWPG